MLLSLIIFQSSPFSSSLLIDVADPLSKCDGKLGEDLPPVGDTDRPFTLHIFGRQIQHLQQRLIGGERTLPLGYLRYTSGRIGDQ